MSIKIIRQWETVKIEAYGKKPFPIASIELTMNRETKSFTMCTKSEESVSFKGDTIELAKLKIKCMQEAIKFMEENP